MEKIPKPPYLWPVGPGGLVASDRILAAGRWSSAPIRRSVRMAKSQGKLVDLTYGRACIWVLFLDSCHLVLISDLLPVTALDIDELPDNWSLFDEL